MVLYTLHICSSINCYLFTMLEDNGHVRKNLANKSYYTKVVNSKRQTVDVQASNKLLLCSLFFVCSIDWAIRQRKWGVKLENVSLETHLNDNTNLHYNQIHTQ